MSLLPVIVSVGTIGEDVGLTLSHANDAINMMPCIIYTVSVWEELKSSKFAIDVAEYHCGQAYCKQESPTFLIIGSIGKRLQTNQAMPITASP